MCLCERETLFSSAWHGGQGAESASVPCSPGPRLKAWLPVVTLAASTHERTGTSVKLQRPSRHMTRICEPTPRGGTYLSL
ncbi:hypothetical protein GDO78_017835 [Eleutherodactylus coqui]|uniref:Uncharacterized protein n=1 Tax=Eleutherodactylus coqui TaxID=57060 RepID=A0A8J6B131_ELECQ|nr:hypothetical protein GDO78_017835 [Eleutherodactylus coqui]